MNESKKFASGQGEVDNACWDAFVTEHANAHLLQTSAWGALKAGFGWQAERVVLTTATGAPAAGALVLFRRVAGLKMAYIPRGPLTDWHDVATTRSLLAAIVVACRRQGAAFLKVEPELPDCPPNRELMGLYGLRPSPQTVQPPSSIVLDLTGSEATLLERMKSKWRYNIRLATRKGVTVRAATRADLPAFNALMRATGQRDGFAVHDAAYYAAAFDLFTPHRAAFLLAEYEDQPIAALVVARCGSTAWYLWGASSEHERNRMPNYALQWAAMRWARSQGATHYDLWGIPDDLGKLALGLGNGAAAGIAADALPIDLEALPETGLWGVYRFKQGFGGQVTRTVGAWDLPLNPTAYQIYRLGLGVRERLKEIHENKELQEIKQVGLRKWLSAQLALSPQFPTAPTPHLPGSESPKIQVVHQAQAWRDILASLPNPHILQSWEWGEIKAQTEWRASRYLLRAGDQVQGAWQLLTRQLGPTTALRIGYIPKGPLIDWGDLDLVDRTLAQIEATARAKGCIFVKIDPDVSEECTSGRLVLHALERRGWRFSADQIQFKNSGETVLSEGAEALLATMKPKWRYNILLAQRRGIRIRCGGNADLPAFHALYAETGQRDGFLTRPYSYYRATWETFLAAQADSTNPAGGVLLLAEHEAESAPVAGLILLRYGARAWYFYGASSERRRRDMPNYLLQWEALRWAIAQGCTLYDWWGAPTEIDNADDPMQGVWQFKQGFGAKFQPHIGAWDFPVSPLRYQLYTEVMPRVIGWLRRQHEKNEQMTG